MILVKTWLECVSKVSIGYSSIGVVSGVLVELMLLSICVMCPFNVAMEFGRCFIGSTVRLGHVDKRPLLMAWSKVLRKGINIVAWYHCARSGLVLYARVLSAAGYFWNCRWYEFLVILTFHMPDMFGRVPYNVFMPYFTTLRLVALMVDVHTSSHSLPIYNMSHDCRWGNMCNVLDVGVRMGLRFRNVILVSYMRLPQGIITWGVSVIGCFLS